MSGAAAKRYGEARTVGWTRFRRPCSRSSSPARRAGTSGVGHSRAVSAGARGRRRASLSRRPDALHAYHLYVVRSPRRDLLADGWRRAASARSCTTLARCTNTRRMRISADAVSSDGASASPARCCACRSTPSSPTTRRGSSWPRCARPSVPEHVTFRWLVKALTPPIVVIGAKGLLRRLGLLRPALPEPEPAVDERPVEPPEFEALAEGWDGVAGGWTQARSPTPIWRSGQTGSPRSRARGRSASTTRRGSESRCRAAISPHTTCCSPSRTWLPARLETGARLGPRLGWWTRALRSPCAGGAPRYAVRLALSRGAVGRGRRRIREPRGDVPHGRHVPRAEIRLGARQQLPPVRTRWSALLVGLARATSGLLLVTRLPIALEAQLLRRSPASSCVRLWHGLCRLGPVA